MTFITFELKWLKVLHGRPGVDHPRAINLVCDSQLTSHIVAQNPVFDDCTKHIEVDCHYVCDAI